MISLRQLMPVALGFLAAGCMYDFQQFDHAPYSHAPSEIGHKPTVQKRVHSAAHWQVLAAEVAADIAEARDSLPGKNPAFFIEGPDDSMPFSRSFHNSLMTEMLKRGLVIALSRPGAYRIHTDVQRIPHEQVVFRPFEAAILGGATAAAAAVHSFTPIAAGTIGVGTLAFELINGTGLMPFEARPEVTLTVSLVRGDKIYSRSSRTFYVTNKELAQYIGTAPPTPLVVHDTAARKRPLKVKSFPVVSNYR